jgi:hypothetical protein
MGPMVGRTFYLEIRQGTLSSRVFFGTRHAATGDVLWQQIEWGTDMGTLTQSGVLDELWAAAMSLMEASSHVG